MTPQAGARRWIGWSVQGVLALLLYGLTALPDLNACLNLAKGCSPGDVLVIAACGLQLLLFGVWFEFGERHRKFVTPFLLLALCWSLTPGAVEKARRTS